MLSAKESRFLISAGTLSLLAIQTAAFSAEETKSETPPPFKVAGKTSRNIQKYTGMTWLAEQGIGLSSSLAAKITMGGHPKIKVRAYSLTDCLQGKFKSVSAELHGCSVKKVPIGNLRICTTTPLQIRLFKSRQSAAGVAAPVMVAVSGEVSETDVSRALASPEVSSQLSFLRLQLPGLGDQHLQVIEPKVKIENGKVKINTWLVTANAPKETGVGLVISAEPALEKERFIILKDTKIDSKDINEPELFSKFSEDLLNPLLDFARFDRKSHAFRLTQFNLAEQKVHFEGKLLLVPKPVQAASIATKSQH